MPELIKPWQDLALLCRFPVCIMVAAVAGLGCLLALPASPLAILGVCLGAFALGCACSAWNQAQEGHIDALIPRTANRPVAAGRLSPKMACIIGLCFAALALGIFSLLAGAKLVCLGLVIILGYNVLYTPLKPRTTLALLPGAAVGASPVLLGWVAGNGSWATPLPVLLYGILLLWQIPHFWLRVQQWQHHYQLAGLPLPSLDFSPRIYRLFLVLWLVAFASALLLLAALPLLHTFWLRGALAGVGLLLFPASLYCWWQEHPVYAQKLQKSKALIATDGTMGAVLLVILLDTLPFLQ